MMNIQLTSFSAPFSNRFLSYFWLDLNRKNVSIIVPPPVLPPVLPPFLAPKLENVGEIGNPTPQSPFFEVFPRAFLTVVPEMVNRRPLSITPVGDRFSTYGLVPAIKLAENVTAR